MTGYGGEVNFHDRMPPDPFANDPQDPASFLWNEDEDYLPATEEEKRTLREDLKLLRDFRNLLEKKGIRGVMIFCDDCEDPHYYDWNIIESNIQLMLSDLPMPVHEPSLNPNPEAFATWDFCLGYREAARFYRKL